MIPKVIHYCWFGGNPLSELAQKCIESWKKFCPDYEIVRWDETNFDVNQNNYCREAYDSKKWAFVSDYARLKVLYEYGGIYMDTDVEVVRGLDAFLDYPAFSGFEDETHISTGIMASKKNGNWVKKLLSYYDNRHFVLSNGELDLTTNVVSITNMTLSLCPLQLNNTFQNIENLCAFFPKDYFCPKDYVTGELNMTKNTYTIHHYDGSWVDEKWRWRSKFIQKYYKYIGKTGARYLSLVLYCIKKGEFVQIYDKIKEIMHKIRKA